MAGKSKFKCHICLDFIAFPTYDLRHFGNLNFSTEFILIYISIQIQKNSTRFYTTSCMLATYFLKCIRYPTIFVVTTKHATSQVQHNNALKLSLLEVLLRRTFSQPQD